MPSPTSVAGTTSAGAQVPREEVLEVKTGLFGLGKRLYVPGDAVHDLTMGCVFLAHTREQIDGMEWDQKPSFLA